MKRIKGKLWRWDGGDSENVFQFLKCLLNLLYYCFCFFMFLIFGSEAGGSDQERNQLHCFESEVLTTGPPVNTFKPADFERLAVLLPMKQLEILMWNLKKAIWNYRCQPENLMPRGEILSHKDYWNLRKRI